MIEPFTFPSSDYHASGATVLSTAAAFSEELQILFVNGFSVDIIANYGYSLCKQL
jgi:hypothetical protein